MENRHYEMEIEMIISYNLSLTIYEYRGKNRLFDNREAHSDAQSISDAQSETENI